MVEMKTTDSLPETFDIEVDGRTITARRNQSIAAALMDNGIKTFRTTRKKEPRGPFCGIGLCGECRTTVDGVRDVRACVTPATPGCKITIQDDALLERADT